MLVSQTVTDGMFFYGDTNVYSDIDISPDSKSPSQTAVTLANFGQARGCWDIVIKILWNSGLPRDPHYWPLNTGCPLDMGSHK